MSVIVERKLGAFRDGEFSVNVPGPDTRAFNVRGQNSYVSEDGESGNLDITI
jgi:hypothetical protein